MTSRTCISERLRLPLISAVAVSVIAVSGCSGGGDPQAGPTATAVVSPDQSASGLASATRSATPTPKPTPVYRPADAKGRAQNVPVPVKPALADKNTKEGLEAFTQYWFQALSYAYETGNSKLMEAGSGPNCRFCNGLRDNIKNAWQGKQWIVGGKIQTPSVSGLYKEGATSQQATVQVIQQEITIYKADGTPFPDVTKQTNTGSQAVAKFGSSGWTVIDLGLIR
ncbi:DUF6318 family protein [Arthrobacter globiformis]|uniref:DUF6318 family protein n=1 Tax=Arthrobacter globiformis TaxID=1665 RepID=UPI00278FD547|nr:DUF6318 family protein [Arthrobacter globiformis]MDQ0617196.1 hypothetical protein [Arthrobacter globiformis]